MTPEPGEDVSRRSVLRKGAIVSGAVVAGGTTVAGRSTAQDEPTGLASKIESHGHYAWFPKGPETWGRSAKPYDMQDDESRWMAQPDSGGSVRVLGKSLGTEPPDRSTGFDIHLGRLRTIETVTVTSRTLQTSRGTGPAELALALYLDKEDNGEFFTWETNDDGTETYLGTGDDDEGILLTEASGEMTIDGDTVFALLNAETEATLADLRNGNVDGVTGETVAGIYVGVINRGEGIDEIVVEDVSIRRA